jgi:hypothetical protein
MIGEQKERWRELCELVAVEQDPERLLEMVKEITRLLEEKQARLRRKPASSGSNPGSFTQESR